MTNDGADWPGTALFGPDTPVRYIKLGPGGAWAKRSLEAGEIHFGHKDVSHQMAMAADREGIVGVYRGLGRTPSKAADYAREILAFYGLGPESIWVTFADGMLWWARAQQEVRLCEETAESGFRYRPTIGGWRNDDLAGRPLSTRRLSSRLTSVGSYRQTICEVRAKDYLLRKLAGKDEPAVAVARVAEAAVIAAAGDLIALLDWSDFETLVDLLLTRAGWSRVSALGGLQKDFDLIVEQPVTGETAFVQVKSEASQRALDDYVERFDRHSGYDRLIFACHAGRPTLKAPGRQNVILWDRPALAKAAARAGLIDWLIDRAG